MNNQNYISKLSNAPLREVVFELKWMFGLKETGEVEDIGYPLAVGRFYDKMLSQTTQNKYIEKTNPLKGKQFPHFIEHQFWTEKEGQLPVVQFGAGVVAVNDSGETYVWEDSYFPLVLKVIDILKESYPVEKSIGQLSLQYINVIEIPEGVNIEEFIKDAIQIEVNILYPIPFEANSVNIRLTTEYLTNDGSILNTTFSIHYDNKLEKIYLMFKNTVTNNRIQKLSEIPDWLEKSHKKTSSLFRQMINPAYYEKFK